MSARTILLLATIVVLWPVAIAAAGDLLGPVIISGDATGSGTVTTVVPNNDEEPGVNPNTIGINLTVTGLGPIDKRIAVGATGGVTEYFVTETVTNGIPNFTMTDYHLELGWWVNNAYQASIAGDGLDFDWGLIGPSNTPPPTATTLTTIINNASEDMLDYFSSNAADVVPPFGSTTLTYSIDVPDPIMGATHIVIRQWATPEPASLLICAIGSIALMWRRR